jgi:hypothetical protein
MRLILSEVGQRVKVGGDKKIVNLLLNKRVEIIADLNFSTISPGMSMRRFTRLTNAFSKKVENLTHAVSLHFMHYNFARIHKTLRVTPAKEAGVSDHVWSLEEIAALTE